MSWAIGGMIVCGVLVVIYLAAEVIHEGNPMDDTDYVAQQKRLNHQKATKAAGELRHHR